MTTERFSIYEKQRDVARHVDIPNFSGRESNLRVTKRFKIRVVYLLKLQF